MRKLRHGAHLTQDDEEALIGLVRPPRRVQARSDIVPEGSMPRSITLVVEGWACIYRQLENGKRQIISLLLPGDLSEPFGPVQGPLEHPLGALTSVTVAQLSPQAIRATVRGSPGIEEALWWDLSAATAIEREHVVSLGRRSASERLGHLFCELQLRLGKIGMLDGPGYDFPVTQGDLADLLGLSAVHINRSIQELRSSGLISLRGRRLVIHDIEALRAASLFDPTYLQPDKGASGPSGSPSH